MHLEATFGRSQMESMVEDLIDRLTLPCEACLVDAGLQKEDLTSILLVGGMTRMPSVREKVTEIFGQNQKMALILTR